MRILYCNVAKMNSYNGSPQSDPMSGGGAYIKNHIGHEVNNFTNHDGLYYGFVQSKSNTIDISKHFGAGKKEESVDGVLVVWFADHRVVGFYKEATVYRTIQHISDDAVLKQRIYDDFNIVSSNGTLIPANERTFRIEGNGQSNVWYGDPEFDQKTIDYIDGYEKKLNSDISVVEDFDKPLEGYEKELIIKARVNQNKFRKMMLQAYKCKCCLCGVQMEEMLVASHIKPWRDCDPNEKVSPYNGLLLCPNHDRAFDGGLVSFERDGLIMISHLLSETDRIFLNIREDMRMNITSDVEPFMAYHRKNIFKK